VRSEGGETVRRPEALANDPSPPLVVVLKVDRVVLFRPRVHTGGLFEAYLAPTVVSTNPAWDELYRSALTPFQLAELWFKDEEDLENERRVRLGSLELIDPGLELARRAVEAVLPGFSDPHIERGRDRPPGQSRLVLRKNGTELTADLLSDGERSLLVLTLAIAQRLALLAPDAQQEQRAVVVIDEIELHLHPKWQRTVIPALLRAFPNCQFIVTTHSPQVLGSVPRECIVILHDFKPFAAPYPTAGRDSNAILEEIMDTPIREPAAGDRLARIDELLDADEIEAARSEVDALAREWGEDDREVVRFRTALQFRSMLSNHAADSEGR
jgi:hypothetical protein